MPSASYHSLTSNIFFDQNVFFDIEGTPTQIFNRYIG